MIKNLFSGRSLINVFAFTFFVLYINVTAQSIPSNTRLMQVNTVKGSALSTVESSNNFTYHVGTSNGGEIGVDGLSANSVGIDDLFVLKSNAVSGSNVWLKTFTAGNGGTIFPRYVSIDSAENLYVYGQFIGTISAGTTSVTSSSTSSSFLMKINSNGSAAWVSLLTGGVNTQFPKIKCVTDGTDTFLIYQQNHLARFDDATGAKLYDNVYPNTEFTSLALQNSTVFVAGKTLTTGSVFGTETISSPRTGFVLKGDKNANFIASAVAGSTQQADISDISFNSDGKLLMSGFSKSAVSFVTENGTYNYTYNPNSSFENTKIYNYVATIDNNLSTVSFLRTSTAVSSDGFYDIEARNISVIVKPYGNAGNFRLLISNAHYNGRNTINTFTNANGTSSNIVQVPGATVYKLLLSFDALGNYVPANQPQNDGFLSASANSYTLSSQANRLFTTTTYNATNGSVLWSKQKTASISGSLSNAFQQHLHSAENDQFVTSIVAGKANFFGKQINNASGVNSRYVTRLGPDGLPKWFARFHPDSGAKELNISNDFSCVDKDDNFIFLANTSGATSTFIDAAGNYVDFNPNTAVSTKALIKLDKNGNLLWSKHIIPTQGNSLSAAVTADGNGNIHVIGTTLFPFTIDGITVPTQNSTSIFLLKFSATGVLLYAKSYQNVNAYSLLPVFDAQNNLYIFTEPINTTDSDYVFDGVTIPTNPDHLDHLMLKFNDSGEVVAGKNFYANLSSNPTGHSWPNDVMFDGENFIVMGNYYSWTSSAATNFVGLDLVNVPKVYSTSVYPTFLAKVKTDGTVLWQKAVESSVSSTGNYTNIDIDENKNVYMYWLAKDKVSLNGTEYIFDPAGTKILMKLDTDGNLKYFKTTDKVFGSPGIDVMGEDKINVSGFTTALNILNYPINYNGASSFYIATFGDLDTKYLTPTKEYLELNNIEMSNNPDNANTFSFDLINNVNWTANSDNSWLNLSFQSLTGKYDYKNLISGNGDAKIIMSAQTNNTGVNRTSNVLISGDSGVSPKTIAITQSAVLASGETKTFVTTLYPNPTSDVLNIETQQKISKIEIYDLSGKLLKTADGKNKQVSVSQLNKGMYVIRIYTENGVVNSKFIKN